MANVLKLGLTDRHAFDGMNEHVDRYLCGTLGYNADAYEVGYAVVMDWRRAGMFAGYDGIHLYYSGYVPLLIGVMDAFDSLKIPYVLMRYDNVKKIYKPIHRRLARQK
jgi:hypothetical protein